MSIIDYSKQTPSHIINHNGSLVGLPQTVWRPRSHRCGTPNKWEECADWSSHGLSIQSGESKYMDRAVWGGLLRMACSMASSPVWLVQLSPSSSGQIRIRVVHNKWKGGVLVVRVLTASCQPPRNQDLETAKIDEGHCTYALRTIDNCLDTWVSFFWP